ncbi:MAG: AAA family ATPase, partial [Deefgea sp.]
MNDLNEMNDPIEVSAPVLDFSSALVQLLRRKNPAAPANLLGLAGELAKASERGDVCVAIPVGSDISAWLASGLVGEAGSFTPLIVSQQRLYLARYHQYESRLSQQLLALAAAELAAPDEQALKAHLAAFFATSKENPDWQKVSVAAALHQRLTVISGGPGTGKTTTLVKLLALLQMTSKSVLQIGLAAPTGKAAMRMQEAIRKGKAELIDKGILPTGIAAQIPDVAVTLHRLLGSQFNSVQFRHNAAQPLVLD